MNEVLALEYWGSQVPVRLLFFFGVTGYTYATRGSATTGESWGKEKGLEGLKNEVVFSWAFLEVLMWFWIYIAVREGRRLVVRKGVKG
jgi:Increased loss of mitochondrial DNA protein 1